MLMVGGLLAMGAAIGCFIAALLGLINPAIVKQKTRGSAFSIFAGAGFAFFIAVGVMAVADDETRENESASQPPIVSSQVAQASREKPKIITSYNWYEGGTLHKKGALDWQKADHADKLASCSDFVLTMANNGSLRADIRMQFSSLDAVRPYAEELVDFIDGATKKELDPKMNEMLYRNQTVTDFAVIGMVMMGWTK